MSDHRFEVALSFPDEHRDVVEPIAEALAAVYTRQRVLYDRFHTAEFERPELSGYLSELYRTQSRLLIVVLCPEYTKKRWCGLEWWHIQALLGQADERRIMFLSSGDPGDLSALGRLSGEGYVDITSRSPASICGFIQERLRLNARGPRAAQAAETTHAAETVHAEGQSDATLNGASKPGPVMAGDKLGWCGSTIDGRVAVEEPVGEGGFGIVYRGRHLGFDETVAVKCLKLPTALTDVEREKFLKEFRDEARLLHRLSRKTAGIVQALDVGAAVSPKGVWTPYIVMEWLEGASLQDRIQGRGAGRRVKEAVSLLTPVADALAIAHAEQVAHLDIKPANIFVLSDGSAKLLDFGIAKILTSGDAITRSFGNTMGPFTPAYGAPEQFTRRHGKTGPWTDVFALALVLIELCSGVRALGGDAPVAFYLAAVNEEERPSFSAYGIRVGKQVENVVRRALEVDPRRRFQSAGEMWSALLQAVELSSEPGVMAAPTKRAPVAAEEADTVRVRVRAPTPTTLNRVCTVLCVELGSSEAERYLDSEHLNELVERCLAALSAVVTDLDGTVERVLGDSLMAYFGLYGDSATAAERAVQAALGMKIGLAELCRRLRLPELLSPDVHTGIATGRVFVSAEHSTGGFSLSPTGPPVKLGARLKQQATAGAVLVDGNTYRQVAGLFAAEAIERQHRGERSTATVYRIVGPVSGSRALDVAAARAFYGRATRFIGRAGEMEALISVAEAVSQNGRSQMATVLGPAGVGRSRLLSELADRLAEEQWVTFMAPCSSLYQHTSYALTTALLRARFHIHEDDDREVAAAKLRRGLAALRSERPATSEHSARGLASGKLLRLVDTDEIVEQLLRILGIGMQDEQEVPLSDDEALSASKHRIAAAVADMVREARGPVAILCDDVQWADESSLSLFEDICVRLADSPLLIVVAARPELLERRASWCSEEPHQHRIQLRPLARRHLEAMARDHLRRVVSLPPEVVSRLAEHADGSPLTMVETLYLLIDSGTIVTAGDRWTLNEDRFGELRLPATIQGLVQARLDQLDEVARMLLARAAVIGHTFWDGLLAELDPNIKNRSGTSVSGLLSALCQRGLISARANSTFPAQNEYGFAEASTQRVAYEMLSHKEHRRLHGVVAGWLEEHMPRHAGAALIASHHERAAALPQALAAYRRAGAHAASLGQNTEAQGCYEQACKIDDWMSGSDDTGTITSELFLGWEEPPSRRLASWPERVALRLELGDVIRSKGHYDLAERRYQQARDRIIEKDSRADGPEPNEVSRWRARLDYRLADLEKLRGNLPQARSLVERALQHAQAGGLVEEQAEMWALAASLLRREGRLEEARNACVRGISCCRAAQAEGMRRRQAVSKLLNVLGAVFVSKKQLIRAERCHLQAARVIDEHQNPDQASRSLNNVAAVRYARGDLRSARKRFRQVLHLTERSGNLWVKMTVLANLGEVELGLGNHEIARDYLEAALKLAAQVQASIDLPEIYRNLARARHAAGNGGAALQAVATSIELAGATGAHPYLPSVLQTAAEICAALAHEPELSGQAREVAEQVKSALDEHPMAEETKQRCRELLAGANVP